MPKLETLQIEEFLFAKKLLLIVDKLPNLTQVMIRSNNELVKLDFRSGGFSMLTHLT